jgi:hypothetical protein
VAIIVEFFGIPRLRAGQAEMVIEAETVAQALSVAQALFPGLEGLVLPGGVIGPSFRVSINGTRFVTRGLAERLAPGDHLLILSADAGG